MPGEVIDRPNPKPEPSHIPDLVEQLQVQLQTTKLEESDYNALQKYRRAAAYIAAGKPASQSITTHCHTNIKLMTECVYSDDLPSG